MMDQHSTKEKSRARSKYKGKEGVKIFYQTGEKDTDLPVCSPFSVCSKVDTYGAPFLEKQCRCPGSPCSSSMHTRDGHTIHDRTKQFKICEPVKKLKRCKYFRDITSTLASSPAESTPRMLCGRTAVTACDHCPGRKTTGAVIWSSLIAPTRLKSKTVPRSTFTIGSCSQSLNVRSK